MGSSRRPRGLAACAVSIVAVVLATVAVAAPRPTPNLEAIAPIRGGAAPAPVNGVLTGTVLYDNTGNLADTYYAGQGGHEAIDDLHLIAGGSLDELVFECFDPVVGGTFSATVKIYGNPSGLDLGATPLLGTYGVSGIGRGRQLVTVLLPDAPVAEAHVWVGVQFSSTTAGLVLQDVPAVGTSHDYYVENDAFYDFGGAPKANFALRLIDATLYDLIVSTAGSGSVTRTPDLSAYPAGTPVELDPVPAAHWHFAGWSGDASGADDPLAIVMDADKTILATFEIDAFTLTVSTLGSGSVTRTPDLASYPHGTEATLTAIPVLGHHFVGWGGDTSGTVNPLSLVVTRNRSVIAAFAINVYSLSYAAGPNGTISGAASQSVAHGENGTAVEAIPDPGYRFAGWSDGVTTAARMDLNVVANLAVTATFVRDDLACNGGFEADLAGWGLYEKAELTRVAPGRESDWAIQIRSKSSSDCGVDDAPNCITGTLLGDIYRFTAWVKAGSPATVGRKAKIRIYEYAGSKSVGSSVSAELKLGTAWQRLTLDYPVRRSGSSLSERIYFDPKSSGDYIFLDDVGIELLAAPPRHTLTATAGAGGSIAPAGAVIVNQGDSQAFAITPAPGYRIDDVIVDGTPLGALVTYTFTNVQADHAIEARFAAIPPGANLVTDPSFESGIQNWTKYGDATLTWNTSQAHTGSRSLQVTGKKSFGCDDQPNWVAQTAGVGAVYRFQAWVKAGSATSTGKVKIRVYEYQGSSQVGSTVYSQVVPLTQSWQLLTAEHTVRKPSTTLSMRVTDEPSSSSAIETFLVDDVSISLVSPTASARAEEGVGAEGAAELEFARPTVFPNPARGGATLALSMARPGALRAEIFDLAGRRVRVLADQAEAAAGTHRFALERAGETPLGAGIYFYRAEVDGARYRGRFVILE